MPIGVDTETHLIAPGRLIPRLVCMQLTDDLVEGGRASRDGRGWVYTRDRLPDVCRALVDADRPWVCHNAPFDLAVLAEAWREAYPRDTSFLRAVFARLAEGQIYDTQVRERLLCVATGELEFRRGASGIEKTRLDLATLVRRYLGIDISDAKTDPDAWRLRYSELDGVPLDRWPEAAVEYAALDAVYARDVLAAQRAAIPETIDGFPAWSGQHLAGEQREVAAAWALHLEAAWGLRAEAEAVREVAATWDREISAATDIAREAGLVRPNGTADKKAIQARTEAAYGGGAPRTAPSATFPTGQVKTDAATLRESGDPALAAYASVNHYQLTRSRWLAPLTRATLAPLTSRPTHLVETGRTSWSDPPLQQPPREGGVRECFVPRPGWVYCSVDYDTIELCALAQICLWCGAGDGLASAINAGRDLHVETAAALLTATGHPETYDGAFARYKAGDPELVHMRQVAKAPNFGLPGGLGSRGLVAYAHALYDLTISPEYSEVICRTWHEQRPEVRNYFAWVDATRGEGGTVRHPVSGRLRGGTRVTAAYNGYFQGLVADGAKYAAVVLARAAYTGEAQIPGTEAAAEAFRGCRPVLFLHDEILAELPTERAGEAARAMAEIMRAAMRLHIPDVRIGADPALMRRWYKGAKTTIDAAGELIPWEPK